MKFSMIKKRVLALALAAALATPNAMVAHATGVTETPAVSEVTEDTSALDEQNAEISESEEGLASVSATVSEEVIEEAEAAVAEIEDEEDVEIEEVTEKLPCTIEYESQVVEYGSEFEFGLVTDPEDLQTINFIAGIDLSDAGSGSQTYVNVQMPGELGDLLYGEYTLAEFRELLELAVGFGLADGMLEDLGLGDLNIDMSTVVQLVKIIEKIQNTLGTNETIIIVNEEYYPENVGVYIAGAVTADEAYETAFAVGYLVVVPAGERVDLMYDMETENNIIAREFLVDGTFSLDASAYQDGVKNEEATEEINHLFVGINSSGEFEVINTAAGDEMLSQNGAWAQLSFTAEWDNMKYYSIPIGRAFSVTSETVDVRLVNMDGIQSNYQLSVYDGEEKGMTAVVYDKDGNLLPQEMVDKYLHIRYIGYALSAPEDIYMSDKMPTDAGVYSVIAVYGENEEEIENPRFGMTVGAVLISQKTSSVSVTSLAHKYDNKAVDVLSMIKTEPEKVDVAVITATLSNTDNIEDISLANVTETINIDLPKYADNILKAYMKNVHKDGVSTKEFIDQYYAVSSLLKELGIPTESLDKLVELLEQFPLSVKITFKEQKKANPKNEGIYFVGAVTFDPNYAPEIGVGTLLISEDAVSVEMEENHIFEYDGESHALEVSVKDIEGNEITGEALDENLTVTYLGLNSKSEIYNSTEAPSDLGVYSVIAVYEELDENGERVNFGMAVGNMMIGGKKVPIEAKDTEVFYDGTGKSVEVENADECELIKVFADENKNINIILPESWGVKNQIIDFGTSVESALEQVKDLLDKLPGDDKIQGTDVTAFIGELEKMFDMFCPVQTITVNSDGPKEVGKYQVLVLAYGDDYAYGADTAVLTIVEKDYEVESANLSETEMEYTGRKCVPAISVLNTYGEALSEGIDFVYEIYNSKGKVVKSPVSKGTYKVKITYIDKYEENEETELEYSIVKKNSGVSGGIIKPGTGNNNQNNNQNNNHSFGWTFKFVTNLIKSWFGR